MSEVERRVFKAISPRRIPSTHVIPGYGPPKCPVCGSTWINHMFIPSPEWAEKRLVSVGIELKVRHPAGEYQAPAYFCGECGFVISRAFREKEVVSIIQPKKEAYIVEEVS